MYGNLAQFVANCATRDAHIGKQQTRENQVGDNRIELHTINLQPTV